MADAPNVSSSFAHTPMNPNIATTVPPSEGAPAGGQNTGATTTPAAPSAADNGSGGDKLTLWLNKLNEPEDNQTTPAAPSVGTPPPQPVTPPQVTPPVQPVPLQPAPLQPAPPQPVPWENMQQQQQFAMMQQQNNELQQKLQQQNQVIQNLLQQQQQLESVKQQYDANNIKFDELSTVDEGDAKAIAAGIMKALGSQLEPIKQALQQQQQYTQKSNAWYEQRFTEQKAKSTLDRIIEKHPDFIALQSDPNYLRFAQQRDGKSSLSYDAHAAYEFERGNADYIIDLIDRYKQSIPSQSSITSVAPVQTATVPATPAGQTPELPTLRELNQWMQMRQIDQDQYRKLLKMVIDAQQKG